MLSLATLEALADRVADHTSLGEIVVLRAQPQAGKSYVLRAVRERLESLAEVVQVAPRSLPEEVHCAADAVERQLQQSELVVILVDDFDYLLQTPAGIDLQGRLVTLAVDGPSADRCGVVLSARPTQSLTRFVARGGGSPLAAAANVETAIPVLPEAEIVGALSESGVQAARAHRLVDEYGGHLGLLASATSSRSGRPPAADVERAIFDAASGATGGAEQRLLDLARKRNRPLAPSVLDDQLVPAVSLDDEGRVRLAPALLAGGLPRLLVGGVAAWPDTPSASARRFRCRLHGMTSAIWADRYHGRHVHALIRFLDRIVAQGCVMTLRLLGSHDGIEGVSASSLTQLELAMARWAREGLELSWRIADQRDFDLLHQRQLVAEDRIDGYVLPPSDRIIGTHRGGNDTDAILPRANVGLLAAAWGRARPFRPL